MILTLVTAFLFLLIGDFLSTFIYHCPQHVFGRFHTIVHHGHNRSFLHYAVLTKNPFVLIDGFLGAFFYLITIPFLLPLSWTGVLLGLVLGQLHVVWRHTPSLGWKSTEYVTYICDMCFITTPEKHWQHHENAYVAFGDIFTFYDAPARWWLKYLQKIKKANKL
jgi:hypothetical protein